MPRITVTFKDGVHAWMLGTATTDTYRGMMEGVLTLATKHLLEKREERMPFKEPDEKGSLFRPGRKGKVLSPRGYYLLEPSFMYEGDYWGYDKDNPEMTPNPFWGQCLKDIEVSAIIEIPGKEGSHKVVLEWFQTSVELSSRPITELVREAVATLSFEQVKDFCTYEEWD